MTTLMIVLLAAILVLLIVLFIRISNQNRDGERLERLIREESSSNRKELEERFKNFTDQLIKLTQVNEQKLEKVREVVESSLKSLQEDNSNKLEKMRETVDEKLHSTLERRLGESFKTVTDKLEKVHHGLGEMQNLATGVGDLKRVLTNVKTRGTWGEIQLGNLLEQILTPDQYEKNIPTKKGSRDSVEFAIKLPGEDNEAVYIPIDAKFPKEDYDRLITSQEQSDFEGVEEASKAIEVRIKLEAKKIREKYIDPPNTTDFAILYLPTEGLYAEVIRRDGLFDYLQREYRVTVTGPTTISPFLNSLQMGFRTLAVQKNASEVWKTLGEIKKEFGTFGDILDKTKLKLEQAGKEIDTASRKSRTIERKLKNVQELPSAKAVPLLEETEADIETEVVKNDPRF